MIATVLGTLAAYGLAASRFKAAKAVRVLLITPMIVPVILIAVAVFYVYVKVKLNNSLAGLVLAHSMLALPLVLIVVTSALRQFDANQEMVARSPAHRGRGRSSPSPCRRSGSPWCPARCCRS